MLNTAFVMTTRHSSSLVFMKRLTKSVLFLCCTLFPMFMASPTRGYCESFHNALSLQGFTGLLNTPNAEVTAEGKLYSLYSDQKENKWRSLTSKEGNYMFSVGLFSFAELGARLTDAPGVSVRDLSANFKLKMPFIPQGYYLPDIAFGMQDVGGGIKKLSTKYLVATEELWRFRLSLGYGTGPDRMQGLFGGAEFKAFDWLYLIGEKDTQETNIGIRMVTPELFGYPVKVQVTAKSSINHQSTKPEYAVGLEFPLGSDRHNSTPPPAGAGAWVPLAPGTGEPEAVRSGARTSVYDETATKESAVTGSDHSRLTQLQAKLVSGGFLNVKVGADSKGLLVVEYENARYNHNELDGVGVVAGTVLGVAPSGYDTLRLIIVKKGIRVLQLSAPLKGFRDFLLDPAKFSEFNEQLQITADVKDDADVRYLDGYSNPAWLRSSLVVYPGLKTFVGTEVGNFDYLLSAKLDYFLNTWKGSVLNARWDIPLSWSDNFKEGKAFRNYRKDSQMDRLMLFQALKPTPSLLVNLGGGMILHDSYGTLNEAVWTPGDGSHRFAVKQAYASQRNNGSPSSNNEVYLASYRYYSSPLDLYLTGTGGRFFDNDKGFSLELKRFFGDTAFSVYYRNSRTTTQENVQVGGVQIAFPLTPRRDMKPYPVQLKGADDWSYALETKIASSGEKNSVATSIGVNPQPPFNLEHVFFNRDRLSEPYIRKHLLRIRDAYLTYL
jgi:hypothetical protein